MEMLLEDIAQLAQRRSAVIATAESCTGGWVAQELTSIAGSSVWFDRGFVTYSNAAKEEMLGISAEIIKNHGAVSEQVVKAMAEGVLAKSSASISVSISGVAGPGGGSVEKPVGTVWFAWGEAGQETEVRKCCFDGDRESVRKQAVRVALQGILKKLSA